MERCFEFAIDRIRRQCDEKQQDVRVGRYQAKKSVHVELPGLEEFVLESGALAAVEEITFRSVCVAVNSSIDLPSIRELRFERDLYNVKRATLESRNGETLLSKIRRS